MMPWGVKTNASDAKVTTELVERRVRIGVESRATSSTTAASDEARVSSGGRGNEHHGRFQEDAWKDITQKSLQAVCFLHGGEVAGRHRPCQPAEVRKGGIGGARTRLNPSRALWARRGPDQVKGRRHLHRTR